MQTVEQLRTALNKAYNKVELAENNMAAANRLLKLRRTEFNLAYYALRKREQQTKRGGDELN